MMDLLKFFKKREPIVALDVGYSAIKALEIDFSQKKPTLVGLGAAPISADLFSGNLIIKPETVADIASQLLDTNGMLGKRIVTAIPAPAVITKRLALPRQSISDLSASIQFEASNFIPHNIEAVKIDFHILGETGEDQLDILVVACKNEVIDSYLECFALAGLEIAVIDVDYFAVQNTFEFNYPEQVSQITALLNAGSRYSTISVCQGGRALSSADVPVGSHTYIEALQEGMQLSEHDAESLFREACGGADLSAETREILDRKVEYVVGEITRQLGFFWDAASEHGAIQQLLTVGGSSLVPGLAAELSDKSGLVVRALDPFQKVQKSAALDDSLVHSLQPVMAVAFGLALRTAGDRDLSALEHS
jgi:type IV pilus assembly protein PilM